MIHMSVGLAGNGDIEITRAQNRNFALGVGFHRMAELTNSWSLFLRYKTLATREYRLATEELLRLQALPPNPDDDFDPDLPIEPIIDNQLEEITPVSDPETNPLEPAASPTAQDERGVTK
jgi:hypothetical protein